MNNLKATKRTTSSSGQINKLRFDGFIPAILYGGSEDNIKISLKKNLIKDAIKSEYFMSSVIGLEIEGSQEKVLPREIAFDPLSNEPIHIDFMRVVKGSKIILEIPVKFINNDKSPGLKKGGVLNIVRRTIQLKCPTENIPNDIIIDLENKEIGTSIKISNVKLPENVLPTITDRDFTIATIVSPTIVIEPEKTAEETPEGEAAAEPTGESVEDGKKEDTDDKTKLKAEKPDAVKEKGKEKEENPKKQK